MQEAEKHIDIANVSIYATLRVATGKGKEKTEGYGSFNLRYPAGSNIAVFNFRQGTVVSIYATLRVATLQRMIADARRTEFQFTLPCG